MAETEDEEQDAKRNANNVTMGAFFHHPPIDVGNSSFL